ncbi:hypothetical protein HGRIS_011792 [Hohenbuehelia grisea]|uniref:Fungal N-terminal domain-containing protein n=1 Tax=Hohenbuehelia grisea TaxID=104357 RepID=A0ABR3JX66_9AGAR
MDPLSITASTLAFLEAAIKIKESIELVSHNRKRLRQLAGEVLRGISDIQEVCERHQSNEDMDGADELRDALDELSGNLFRVMRRCEKLSSKYCEYSTPLGKLGASLNAWLNRRDVEADLHSLKDQVQAWHIRFLTFSVARMERRALVWHHEDQARAHQLEGLISRMLLENNNRRIAPPQAIELAVPGDEIHLYLEKTLKDLVATADQIHSLSSNWFEEPDVFHQRVLSFEIDENVTANMSLCRSVLFRVLRVLQELRDSAGFIWLQGLGATLYYIAKLVNVLGMESLSAAIACAASKLYGRLLEHNYSQEFLYYYALTLDRVAKYQSAFDFEEAFRACEAAMTIWAQLYDQDRGDRFAMNVAHGLLHYACHLRILRRYDTALEYSKQGLEVIRNIPYDEEGVETIRWEGSGEMAIVHSCLRTYSRPAHVANSESFSLHRVASNLASSGHYAHAWVAGFEAMNCYEALLNAHPTCSFSSAWQRRLGQLAVDVPYWVSVDRHPRFHSSNDEEAEIRRSRRLPIAARPSAEPTLQVTRR